MNQPRQIRPKPLELTSEELARVAKAKERAQSSEIKVNPEWFNLAEFGYYFGWQAIRDVRENKIALEEMTLLLAGARKVWAGKVLDMAQASFVSYMSSQSSKPGSNFEKGIRSFVKVAKIDE